MLLDATAQTAQAPPVIFTEVTTCIALLAVIIGVIQFWIKILQDAEKQRLTQVRKAYVTTRDLYDDAASNNALLMIDYWGRSYEIPNVGTTAIDDQSIVRGLRNYDTDTLTQVDQFVRDCFDALFLRIENIHALIEVGYLRWHDVDAFVGYYINIMRKDGSDGLADVYTSYAATYGFPRTALIISEPASFPVIMPLPPGRQEALEQATNWRPAASHEVRN